MSFSILSTQHDVVTSEDVYEPEEPQLVISHKLFSAQHSRDIPAGDPDASLVEDVPASVPHRPAPRSSANVVAAATYHHVSAASPPRSVSETDFAAQPSLRVSEEPSSPPMVTAKTVDASIVAVIKTVGDADVSLALDEDDVTASTVGEELISIEEFTASLDALKIVQVPLGEIKATSSKTRGSKRKLELRDVPVTPPVSDDEDDTPIANLKSNVLAKVAAKNGSSSKPSKSVKPSGKKALAKKHDVRMGLMSGCRRLLIKQARAPFPSEEEADDVPESVPDRSDSDSEDFDSKKSAYSAPPFIAIVVHKFYANLSKRMHDASYKHAFSVFVRGNWIAFSPAVINEFLGRENLAAPASVFYLNEVVTELTGGSRVIWPPGRVLLASDLSVKYSILHKIA
ncbi:hypothetical protein C2S52_011515, partial [Perilla frutescens var. hirtella]